MATTVLHTRIRGNLAGSSQNITRAVCSIASMKDKSRKLLQKHLNAERRIFLSPSVVVSRQSKQQIHSSAPTSHSTTSMDFTHSAPSVMFNRNGGNGEVPKPPSWKSLKGLFVASAIPMVGFGFMDNFVMIQAGQYIDSTLGVSLGLATMTAAAAGQVVSDVSGVLFGGTLERFLTKLNLMKTPALTTAQRELSICRNVSMAGAVIGVIIGCTLGATTLLLVDLEARHRMERATQLREIVTDMISAKVGEDVHSETATIYIASDKDFHIDQEEDKKWRTSMKLLEDADSEAVVKCAKTRETTLGDSKQFLYTPVVRDDNVIAVIEFRHNRDDSAGFTDHDLFTAEVMARHVAIFMDRLVE